MTNDVQDVITAGRIDPQMYVQIAEYITTDEVIITQERIDHSNLHDNAYDKYGQFIPLVLSDPDFIFRDKKQHTVVLIRSIDIQGKSLQLVLRLHVQQDHPEYKNSILSFWDIGESRRRNYEKNKDIVYKRSEI